MHGFVRRVPDVDVGSDRHTALRALDAAHRLARRMLSLEHRPFVTAEQVHGAKVGVVAADTTLPVGALRGVDALVTDQHHCLGIYVADCAAVFLFDQVHTAIGLAHSGRKGTELGVVPSTIRAMTAAFGTKPADLVVQIGPCIRPPHYETDFAARILEQCRAEGVTQLHDCGVCTHADGQRYYSYRREQGRTGRMLALLALR